MKDKMKILLLFTLITLFSIHPVSAQTLTAPMLEEGDVLEIDHLTDFREMAWEQWEETMLESEELQSETENFAMTFGEATMRYTVKVFGEKNARSNRLARISMRPPPMKHIF